MPLLVRPPAIRFFGIALLLWATTHAPDSIAVAPFITTQPTNQTVVSGSNVTFIVGVSGTAPLTYRWLKDGSNIFNSGRISGATSRTLIITGVLAGDTGGYRLVATNSQGAVTSSVAALTVLLPPAITTQPTNQIIIVSNSVSLSAGVSGTGPLTYRWQKNGTNLSNGGRISGATNLTLNLTTALTNDTGSYRLVATNAYGAITSAVATLAVTYRPTISTIPYQRIFPSTSTKAIPLPSPTWTRRRTA